MYKKRTYARKSKRSYKKRTRTRRSRTARPGLMRTIKRVLMRNSETKYAVKRLEPTKFNAAISTYADMVQIIPDIGQGVGDDERVGSSIIPLTTTMRGYVTFAPGNIFGIPLGSLDVKMYCLRNKKNKDPTLTTGDNLLILKQGVDKIPFDGTIDSTTAVVNTEDFDVLYSKSFKLLPNYGDNPPTSATPSTGVTYVNNPLSGSATYKFVGKVNWKKHCKKIMYSTGSDSPTNLNAFWCLGFAQYNDPSNAVSNAYTPVQASWTAVTTYKDF